MAAQTARPLVDWFSPLPPARSDIAHFSARILPALSARADVRLWTDQPGSDPALARHAEVIVYDPRSIDLGKLNKSNLIFYNMGNDGRFHAAIREVMFKVPGVLVAHELSYHHSMYWDYMVRRQDPAGYLALVEQRYGAAGLLAAKQHMEKGKPHIDELARQYPFIDYLADASLAVVCHTRAVEEAVTARGVGALRLPLAFQAPPNPPSKSRTSGVLEFVQFGYIGPQRRLFSILGALSRFREKHPFRLRIFGELWDPDAVRAEIRRQRLDDLVSIVGFVAEPILDSAIARADLVFNLRYPSIGEASGSQMRIWAAGAPSVVTNTGWYGDLPNETVIKIEQDTEAADLDRVLTTLARDRFAYAQTGLNGFRHLAAHHGPDTYVEQLLSIKDLAEERRSSMAYRHLTARADTALERMFGRERAAKIKAVMNYQSKFDGSGQA
ncbi:MULTISPECIES: hypothetical protein [unclassified Chelatococcus]|uniref:hypothetical protein n=1 Tax=unclassified Chelatococcus TaxID=2638111 RepID=UPI001BD06082|nr:MULTISPECIES: hypothetical protein [unclassified Chelatococcus]CAH1670227.1 Glycosyltransferase involved in cell wall biosynthesis [Hyphomicrobiales bacterium]MBS7738312.1 glycosyltransferase family 4 protein [Chelatococcus sp. HY11]MBX3545840.1 glycosyltransferase family 4 protein [Chelatococcus sp.]MCO5077342.1 hypothetical protein [Chelatococcus sp.]CAH1677537.1 Glycosyltransferase involved in cell wall biosynthesis [Hyphomicrobiales bacterium]